MRPGKPVPSAARPTKPVAGYYLSRWVGALGANDVPPSRHDARPSKSRPGWRRWADHVRLWLPRIAKQRCRYDENWPLSRPRRYWVTFKALTALLCGREGDCRDHIEVAVGQVRRTYSYEYGEGGDFDYFAVPFRGWRYAIGSDGWP